MFRYLLVFHSEDKVTTPLLLINNYCTPLLLINNYYTHVFDYGYNHHPYGHYQVQANSIYYNAQTFLKSSILIRIHND